MSTHTARIDWSLADGDDFAQRRYSRAHTLTFDGGTIVTGSPSPSLVPEPFSNPAGVDPEELLVAALSACHMLWFLDLTSRQGRVVERYADQAEGVMARNPDGKLAMTRVILRPEVRFAAPEPSATEVADLHHLAHEACFIASSVRTAVIVEPRA